MRSAIAVVTILGALGAGACGGGGGGQADAGPEPAATDHCSYTPLPATARAGGQVTAGPIRVGLAEAPLDLPVGSALGGNTSRAIGIGNKSRVDTRRVELSGAFNPSVGIETIPMVKAIAIEAGDETVVILRTDTIFSDDTITHELAERLGPDLAGKVLWSSSHTHTAPEQYSADSKLQVGGGVMRDHNRRRLIEAMTDAAEAALADLAPARLGVAVSTAFDPDDRVSYDRRPENDHLFGGERRKDDYLAVIRVDSPEGTPRAILPVFGVHSAILSDEVSLFSTDVSGMYERLIEEEFDHAVMVVHLQGAAGDVLASGGRRIQQPAGFPDWDFARSEDNARWALPEIMALWEAAGEELEGALSMEMVTRSIELGPDWRTFTIRDGALAYAPFEPGRPCDRAIFDDDGAILSPIDEFNARWGAGLCGDPADDIFSGQRMPNTEGLGPYQSCAVLPDVLLVLAALIDLEFEEAPLCASTRTTVSALRLGDYLFATAPGEPLVLWAEHVRALSPVAPERTFILGYAQGHIGYLLTAEDWLSGGFEPSINLWGPLEGELIAERLAEVMALAVTDAREDAAAGGADRTVAPVIVDDDVPPPDPAPLAGTVPAQVPDEVYTRWGLPPQTAQPAAVVERVTGVARFVWIGEDPLAATPRVTLEREGDDGFAPVTRRSGRAVTDLDFLVIWTPLPLRRDGTAPRTHYFAVEWQAVSWLGAPGLAELADRPGLPLGRYRFRVDGAGYTVHSDPFEVVAGPLSVTASVEGDDLRLEVGYEAVEGWRLLAREGLSNRFVPVAEGPLTVELHFAEGEPQVLTDVALDAPGVALVPRPGDEPVEIRVSDRFGNTGAAS